MTHLNFVTGASGHVGANLVRALLARGEPVRALVVPRHDNSALDGLKLERVAGDLRDLPSLERALAGCTRLYHVAAYVSLLPGARKQLFDVNVVGTRNLLWAAQQAGVERTVLCSSFGAVGRNPQGASDETWTVDPFDTHLDYELSKGLAEVEALRAVVRGLDVVMVNPCGVVGPHDYLPSSVGKAIIDFARGRMPAYVPGGYELVPVRDVVQGHLLAMEKGRRGERYILSSEYKTLDEILAHLEKVTGRKKPRLRIPAAAMVPLAHLSSFLHRRFFPSVPPRFTPGTIKLLQSRKTADGEKARTQLGYRPTPVLDAFTESVEWFRSRGAI